VGTFGICERFMKAYISDQKLEKDHKVTRHLNRLNGQYFTNAAHTQIPRQHCSNDTLYRDEWEPYTGTYKLQFKGLEPRWYVRLALALGYYPVQLKIRNVNGVLLAESMFENSILRHYRQGIFFLENGEVMDFSSTPPRYRNIEMEKRGI
jgi:hypothetical protein